MADQFLNQEKIYKSFVSRTRLMFIVLTLMSVLERLPDMFNDCYCL